MLQDYVRRIGTIAGPRTKIIVFSVSFLKSFVSKHIHAAAAMRPTGQEAVAIFFYGQAPTPEDIVALATGTETSVTASEGKTRIAVTWGDASLNINIDPGWDKTVQMAGMRGWTERFPQRIRELPHVRAFVETFDKVNYCYGTVAQPALNASALSLLKEILRKGGGGFFFSRNSFYDADGSQITGFDDDPIHLGVTK